jgi:hypothetical protein
MFEAGMTVALGANVFHGSSPQRLLICCVPRSPLIEACVPLADTVAVHSLAVIDTLLLSFRPTHLLVELRPEDCDEFCSRVRSWRVVAPHVACSGPVSCPCENSLGITRVSAGKELWTWLGVGDG